MLIGKVDSASTHNHQIQARQIVLLVSEALPDQSFDQVSVYGPLQNFFCNRCSQAGIGTAINQEKNGKAVI